MYKDIKNRKLHQMFEAVEMGRGVEFYKEWVKEVTRNVTKDRVLMFNVKEGWEPLCKHLGMEKPEQPFPYVNSTADFQVIISMKRMKSWILFYEFISIPTWLFWLYHKCH